MIKRLRKEKHLSLLQVSGELGISESFLSQIENGKRKPSMNLLEAIAKFFERDPDEISISLGIVPAWVVEKMMNAPERALKGARNEFRKYEK